MNYDGMPRRPARTSQREPERPRRPHAPGARVTILATIPRGDDYSLSLAQLEYPGRPTILTCRHMHGDTVIRTQEFRSDEDLDALALAVATVQAARKAAR